MSRATVTLLAMALATSAASADIDVETALVVKANSTLVPQGELETFRFQATAGTKLTFTLANAKGSHLQFAPSLADPNGTPVPLGPDVLKTNSRGVVVKDLPLLVTGKYRLDVSAQGTGGYSLTLKGATQTRFSGPPLTFAAMETKSFAFSAPAGSALSLSAKSAKASAATPRFGLLQSGAFSRQLGTLGRLTTSSHAASVAGVGGTGDFAVEVTDAGSAGDVNVVVTVRPPRVKASKFDLRGSSLGRPTGGETFLSQVIGAGGGLLEVTDPASDLVGASVSVPAGALTFSVPISVASAPPLNLPDDAHQAAGPTVRLEPSGTIFATAVTVTIPFDFAQLAATANPSDIRVFVREKDGATTTIVPLSVDLVHNTVTVQTSHFSSCVAIAPVGIRRIGLAPGGDEYWAMFLSHEMGQDLTANDSRSRQFRLSVGEVSFFGDGTFQVSTESRKVQVDHVDDQNGGVDSSVQSFQQPDNQSGNWTYDRDGQSIDLTSSGQDTPVLRVSRSGDVMIAKGGEQTSSQVEFDVLLKKNKTPLAVADLSGVWRIFGTGITADPAGPGASAHLEADHFSGTVAFDGKGGYKLAISQRQSQFQGGATTWESRAKPISVAGTYSVEETGTALMNIPPEKPGDTGNVFRLFPGPGADALLGSDRDAQAGNLSAFVLVRQGAGMSIKDVVGPCRAADVEIEVNTYTAGGNGSQVVVGDLNLKDEELSTVFDGTSSATFQIDGHKVSRDSSSAGGVQISAQSSSFDSVVTLSSTGALRIRTSNGSVIGAVARNGDFGVFMADIADTKGDHLFGMFVLSPPAR